MTEKAKCGCGRSPTGYCIGWHSLSEADYIVKKAEFEKNENAAGKEEK
jgi:hypothetical protein